MLSWSLYKLRVFHSIIPKKYILFSTCQFHFAGQPYEKQNQNDICEKKNEDFKGTRNYLTRLCRSSCTQSLVSSSKTSLAAIEEYEEVCSDWEQPRVVIVGAGLAGLAAAHRLTQGGIQNYILLEASDRPGGRVMTAWLGDVVVEVGAEWIYGGSPANPAYVLASLEQLLPDQCHEPCDPMSYRDNRPYYLTSSTKVIEDTFLEEMIFEEVLRGASKNYEDIGCTLAQYLSMRFNQELKHFPKDRQADGEKVLNGMLGCMQTRVGADLSDVSLIQCNPSRQLPGGDVRVPQGMAGILSPLIKTLCSAETIRYNCPVDKIKYGLGDGLPRALVQTADGQEFVADYVIVTIPLGVLKCSPDLFCPELSETKLRAIEKLGFGKSEHIYAEYSRSWWACPQPLRIARSTYEMQNKDDWTGGITSIEPKPGSTHILSATISGSDADLLDEVVEESIAIDLTKSIRKYTGDPTIPYPINILRSKWSSNQFFNGSRTYMSKESKPGHVKTLAEPFPEPCIYSLTGDPKNAPVLFFAGEATSVDFYGTIHGAIVSGSKQASKIIEFTREFKGVPVVVDKKCDVVKQLSRC